MAFVQNLVRRMVALTEHERTRFDRQIRIPRWGVEGQERLKRARVGIIGTGGLGSPITIYLAVAGIGRIVLADGDVVERSNLNRQILHWDRDIGRKKAASAEEKLRQLNPEMEIISYDREITGENIEEVFRDVDAVVDALDNLPSRFLLNEFAVRHRLPLFHGAVWGLEGRASTIIPGKTVCLRCIYPEELPEEVFPVAGVTPALIGVIQATEVLKYFTGIGELLLNQLLIYDGEMMSFSKLSLKRESHCPVCGSL